MYDGLRTISRFARKACREGFLWSVCVLKEKLKIFLSKHAHSDRFFLARLFFRRKKIVRKKVAIIYEHVLTFISLLN